MEDFPIESGGEGVDFVRTLSRYPDRALHPEEQVETADSFLQPSDRDASGLSPR